MNGSFMKLPTLASTKPMTNGMPPPIPNVQTTRPPEPQGNIQRVPQPPIPPPVPQPQTQTAPPVDDTPQWYKDTWGGLSVPEQQAFAVLPDSFRYALVFAKYTRNGEMYFNGEKMTGDQAFIKISQQVQKYHNQTARQERHTERQVQRQPIPYRVMA